MDRREFIGKCGLGIAGIIAGVESPAAVVRSMIAARNGFAAGPEIVPVEYIESTGTQWIDTGVIGRNNIEFTCRVAFTHLEGNASICASYGSGAVRVYPLNISNPSLVIAYGYGNYFNSTLKPTLNTWYDCATEITSTGQKGFVNGIQIWDGNVQGDINSGLTLSIFRMNGLNNARYAKARLASLYLDVNGDIRDYQPVRVGSGSTWEGALFDKANNRVYLNAGSGSFIVGADI